MVVYKVNKKRVSIPTCWEESTCGLYQRLLGEVREGDDLIKVFAILSGLNYRAVADSTDSNLEAVLYQATAFVFNQPQEFKKLHEPKSFKIQGHTILIPSNVGKLTVVQNLHLRAAIAKAEKNKQPLETLISLAMAIYLQPLIDVVPFDYGRAKEIELEILEMNIFDVYPVGFFLLSRLTNYGARGLRYWWENQIQKLTSAAQLLKWPRLKNSSPSTTSASSIVTPGLMVSFLGSSCWSPSMSSFLSLFTG